MPAQRPKALVVDEFIQKPTNYEVFAAKIRMLVQCRGKTKLQAVATDADRPDPQPEATPLANRSEKTKDLTGGGAGPSAAPAESESGHAGAQPNGLQSPATPEVASLSEREVQEALKVARVEWFPGKIEQRSAKRWPYPASELLAACGQGKLPNRSMFREVVCHDLSTTGISFFLPHPPGFRLAVITLGNSTDKTAMLIRVVHSTGHDATGHNRYLVGCQFVRRVSSRELSGSHPVVPTV